MIRIIYQMVLGIIFFERILLFLHCRFDRTGEGTPYCGLFRFSAALRGYEWFLSSPKHSTDSGQFLSEKVYGLFSFVLIADIIIIKTKT